MGTSLSACAEDIPYASHLLVLSLTRMYGGEDAHSPSITTI